MKRTASGLIWNATPSYDEVHVLFGFARPIARDGGEELILHALTVAEARAIATALIDVAAYMERKAQATTALSPPDPSS